jgi:hypothetical protein
MVAMGGAAAAFVAFVSMAATPALAAASVSTPACTAAQLEVSLDLSAGNSGLGSTYFPIDFTNTGSSACTLNGYPAVYGVNSAGDQVGSAASEDDTGAGEVVVDAGGTASTYLRYIDVYNYGTGCDPVEAAGLEIEPPGTTTYTKIAWQFEACSGTATYLQVEPL